MITLPIFGHSDSPTVRRGESTLGTGGGPPPTTRAAPRAVRLSITDRCDLACVYCRPHRKDGFLPSESRLRVQEWATLVAGLARRGVRRVRITGGEPLIHPHVVDIVAAIAAIDGIDDIALTTNATRLESLAAPLRSAGLRRINVSIDSLDRERFSRITRGGSLAAVLRGIEAARSAGFSELKTNTVVMGGSLRDDEAALDDVGNVGELPDIVRFAWSIGATPRFLELMHVGEGARIRAQFVSYATMRASLAGLLAETPSTRPDDRGPARYHVASDGSGRQVGFITGTSDTFCDGCDRLRATSDGALRPCLATLDSVDVSTAVRTGDLDAIARGLDAAWALKPDGVTWKGCTEDSASLVNMRATGG